MYDMPNDAGWWNAISRRVREREFQRLILYNRVRRAVAHPNSAAQYLAEHVSPIVGEFFKMLTGSLLGFWIIALALTLLHARPIYTFTALGLLYSMQAAYYKYRLSRDPAYKIPKCKCAGRRIDGTETVLRSSQSSILKIPTSLLGALLYVALLLSVGFHHTGMAVLLVTGAIAVSAYLSYVMVTKIGSLCVNCINMGALNILILLQLLR